MSTEERGSSHERNDVSSLRSQAIQIWRSGVRAVQPSRLMQTKVRVDGTAIVVGSHVIDLRHASDLVVVGAGKASAGMASAFVDTVCNPIRKVLPQLPIRGWINCPEGSFDSAQKLDGIELFSARPAGINMPTEKAVRGTQEILQLLSSAGPDTVAFCLLSGGGSALLTAPVAGVTLEDKQIVAKLLAAAGANIEQLNTVRRALSQVKAGGLARACRAGRLLTLIISDVLGDPLDVIASGPTYGESAADPQRALDVLAALNLTDVPELANVKRCLQAAGRSAPPQPLGCEVSHFLLGNNADAVAAAESQAVALGYQTTTESASGPEGDVGEIATHASAACRKLVNANRPGCWISGGEPTVQLPESPGIGGRNQQLALQVLTEWFLDRAEQGSDRLVFLSGGTDGEDGPTTAAGAIADLTVAEACRELGLDPHPFLQRANAYAFFQQTDGLLVTGGTGTNVCDLRVALYR